MGGRKEANRICAGRFEDVQITVYEPTGAPSTERMVHNREVPKMTAGRAALVELIHQYLGGLLIRCQFTRGA